MRAALALTAVLSTACASVPVRHVGERRVEDPSWVRSGGLRVRYVGELQGPEHLGIEPSPWKRFWSWLVGEREATALSRPFALGFAADGRVAVADPGNRAVRVYDAARHQHLRLTEGLSAPLGVAFVGELLVVADAEARALRGFDVEGAPVALPWKLPPFGRPVGVAWDAAGQRLFVGDAVEHCVHVLTASGAARPARVGPRRVQLPHPPRLGRRAALRHRLAQLPGAGLRRGAPLRAGARGPGGHAG